ncbi:MAG: LysM peptidoglycan-binding domain-containing protein [Actinobacteria bacterium]|nr:LysM peptidoglycan-binding domain-containing protein [Actinomycetota bacterium]
MGRTGVRRRRFVLTLVSTTLSALLIGPVGHGLSAGAQVRREADSTYVVGQGDTLWSIAAGREAPGEDPRPLIDAIERANGIGPADLVPGQTLVVPASS